jgi:hypothetical protein
VQCHLTPGHPPTSAEASDTGRRDNGQFHQTFEKAPVLDTQPYSLQLPRFEMTSMVLGPANQPLPLAHAHTYLPLEDENSIRLLHLELTRNPESPLRATILHAHLKLIHRALTRHYPIRGASLNLRITCTYLKAA